MKLCWLLALALVPALGTPCFAARAVVPPEIEPARVIEIAGWLGASPQSFAPPASNRLRWDEPAAAPAARELVARASQLAQTPIPELQDDLYLDFSRTGNRTHYQNVVFERDSRTVTFLLAECLENQGRFLKPLAENIAATCQERSWVLPAHDAALNNFHGRAREMDLRATLVAWDLATCDYLLGDRLPGATRTLIRDNVRQRVLAPFREMIEGKRPCISWVSATHNWNAVCFAGTTAAALALEPSREERAWYVAVAEKGIRSFLSGFTPDGYCSEGIGYWNYGYGRFLMLSELVRQATSGKLDLLAQPSAHQPALFSIRSEVINGVFPSVADCNPSSAPDPSLVYYIGRRFGIAGAGRKPAPFAGGERCTGTPLMFTFLPEQLPLIAGVDIPEEKGLRTWFSDGGVLICRPAKDSQFAAVIKGGHNAEHHNHNDLGSFSVVLGKSMLLCDPGSEVYTKRTFSNRRYKSTVLSSYGHSVPKVAGQLQAPGAKSRAIVLKTSFEDDRDLITFDLRSVYPVPELTKLERSIEFRRGPAPAMIVRDLFAFSEPKTFETALITWAPWKRVNDRELLVGEGNEALRVKIESGTNTVIVDSETLEEDVSTRTKPVRIRIALPNASSGSTLTTTIEPIKL